MRIFGWIISLAMLSTTPMIGSQNYNGSYSCEPFDSCETDCCSSQNHYTAYVDYLYWQVCRSGLDISGNGDTHYVDPGYQSGFRIGASYSCDYWDVGFRYTDFCVSKKRTFDYFSSESEEDFATFKCDARILDLELGSSCCVECCHLKLRPFAGAKLAWIDDKFKTVGDYIDENDSKIKFQGQGLYLGGEGRWELCQWDLCDRCIPISFVTRVSTGILNGRFKAKEDNDGEKEKECLYVTVNELFAGVDFSSECCDCDIDLVIGYEVQSWQGYRKHNDTNDIASLGFGGLVVRLGVQF